MSLPVIPLGSPVDDALDRLAHRCPHMPGQPCDCQRVARSALARLDSGAAEEDS